MKKHLDSSDQKDGDFYRSFIEGKGKNIVAFVAQAGQLKYVNEAFSDFLGYSPQEVLDSDFDLFSLIAPEDRRMAREVYLKRLRDSYIPKRNTLSLLTKNQNRIPVIVYTEIIDYQDRKAIQGLIVDISEQKRIEQKLQSSEVRYRLLLENSPSLIVNITETGHIHYINQTFLDLLGTDNFEIEGRLFWTLVVPEDVETVKKAVQTKFITTSTNGSMQSATNNIPEFSLLTRAGAAVPVTAHLSLLELDEGNLVQCIMERNYRKSLIRLAMPQIFLSIIRFGDLGSEPVQTEALPFEEDDPGFLIKTGVYLMASVGMGSEHFLGLSGPLPVSGWSNYFQFVYSFRIRSPTVTDERMEGEDYCLLLIFGPRELEHLFSNRKSLEKSIHSALREFKTLEDLEEEGSIERLKRQILLQEK
ncbi:MAG: PAS domain-containing protein [Candidatus Hodarchaeota archaeon]